MNKPNKDSINIKIINYPIFKIIINILIFSLHQK